MKEHIGPGLHQILFLPVFMLARRREHVVGYHVSKELSYFTGEWLFLCHTVSTLPVFQKKVDYLRLVKERLKSI